MKLFKELYNSKKISLNTYLDSIIDLYQFSRKKYLTIGELTDSDSAVSDISVETYDTSDRSDIDETPI